MDNQFTIYERYVKRALDVVLSLVGLVLLSPFIAVFALTVLLEDPGCVIFKQKRVGRNRSYFYIHKLRTMVQSAPDVPTHMLKNTERYLLKTGNIYRRLSIDELPQLWDILLGRMSLVGPRPAHVNQEDLLQYRDLYGANRVKPGLTGWAQIHGRDLLDIASKARLDGEYVAALKKGGLSGFIMDCRCIVGTLPWVFSAKGVVEGRLEDIEPEKLIGQPGLQEELQPDKNVKVRVAITGAHSYLGEGLCRYGKQHYGEKLYIEQIDTHHGSWREVDFSAFDYVFHVAGIAKDPVGRVSKKDRELYYQVNTDLALEVARTAKEQGVKRFYFPSSLLVYGQPAPLGVKKSITAQTLPRPSTVYGYSKLQADVELRAMATEDFQVVVLRCPRIYSREHSTGMGALTRLAGRVRLFPAVKNECSVLHLDKLCELLCRLMLSRPLRQNAVVLLPQDEQYENTTERVQQLLQEEQDKGKILPVKALVPLVMVLGRIPGAIGRGTNKAFGNLTIDGACSQPSENHEEKTGEN